MLTDEDLDNVNADFIKWINERNEKEGNPRRLISYRTIWGPQAKYMTKEDLLTYLIEVEKRPKTPIDPRDIGNHRPKVDVREWIKEKKND